MSLDFISSFSAIVAGDISDANISEVSKCYDTDALASDLERYFSSIGTEISADTTTCIREQVLQIEDPASIIPFLYIEDAVTIITASASINVALDILFCLTAEEREWADQAEIFGLPVSPGMIDGMNCVADQLNDIATVAKYYISVAKALSDSTLHTEDALIFFDLLEVSATCQFLPANFAPIAMQLSRDDAECMIEQVGTEPLLSFFNFAPKQEQGTLNLTALAPLLGAVNACEISLDLTATN